MAKNVHNGQILCRMLLNILEAPFNSAPTLVKIPGLWSGMGTDFAPESGFFIKVRKECLNYHTCFQQLSRQSSATACFNNSNEMSLKIVNFHPTASIVILHMQSV